MYVYGLYHHRPDLHAEAWDLCGLYVTHLEAIEALSLLVDHDARLERDDFAIDQIALNQALT